jgi:hypothetical protein
MEMKVYTSIQYQMTEGGLLELSADSFDYDGPVSESKGGGSPPPQPPPPPPEPKKEEVVAARKQAEETMGGSKSRRRRGGMGSLSSLLSGGYRGFKDEDMLG